VDIESKGEYTVRENIVPVEKKLLWDVSEACSMTGIGENSMRQLMHEPGVDFVFVRGNRQFIYRPKFERFLERESN